MASDFHHYGMLRAADWEALAPCRAWPGWEVLTKGEDDSELWVRRPAPATPQPADPWQRLPFLRRFRTTDGTHLVEEGARLAARRVPGGLWSLLADFIVLAPRAAHLPGARPPGVTLRAARSPQDERPASLRVVDADAWVAWVTRAPAPRLEPLQFAASSDGRVCVRGEPPPPLPGTAWVLWGAIALPAGYAPPAELLPEWLADTLGLKEGDFALWHATGQAEVLPASAFVPATRSNVRATAGAGLAL